MDFEQYDKDYTISELRTMLAELGGTPGNKNKSTLIAEIIAVREGTLVPVRSKRGRPARGRSASYYKNDFAVSESDGIDACGVLELVPEGYGFLRAENCDYSLKDFFVAKPTIKSNGLREGDFVVGTAQKKQEDKLPELILLTSVNGLPVGAEREKFENLIPVYPDKRLDLGCGDLSTRVIDLFAPIGFGQRGIIVAPPKTGKTTLLKKIASAIEGGHKDVRLMVFLVDERPEEVTDFKQGLKSEVVYSTFDAPPEHHVKIAELMAKRAKRLIESGYDVVILMDSLTKLARAYNSVLPGSGKTLSGGIDPQALVFAKKFFGLARNTDKGSLTIIATALVETGSKMDDVIFEEFKGTGNMEIVLSRHLAEKRVFPAIDIVRSGTRREEALLNKSELDCSYKLRRVLSENVSVESVIDAMSNTKTNAELSKKIDVWLDHLKKSGQK